MTIGDGHDLKSLRFAGDEVLEACYDNERILRKGDKGPAVEKVQEALIVLDFPVPRVGTTGIFGEETELAVMSYQETRGLNVDGIIGSETIESLDSDFSRRVREP
jgi:peptidoglycan hydrolase-like protein with peptidoglycan-binding domain